MGSALEILHSIRIQDVLDIIIIAFMISALLIWFKDRASRFVLVGISLLGLVYLLAKLFQLYLTTIVLQGFFAILIFVLVIIFQEDLRRFFERLALLGSLRKKFQEERPASRDAETIAMTAASLARNRIGALFVIRGDDPLERHLSQGNRLDGLLSQQLLESIFDPHSPGHDGAVIIEGGKVVQFGCHLPLSANAGQLGGGGLRHAAALGLAERSDALCIVVSEERGTISLAQGEEIRPLTDAAELRNVLTAFFARNAPHRHPHTILRWLKENSREKLIALLLACILWLVFGYQKESIRREFVVPIEYTNISEDWVIEEPKTAEAKVFLTGSSQAFQLFKPETLRISLDLSHIEEGKKEVLITQDMVRVPPNISVAAIQPSEINVVVSRLMRLSAPIQIVTENTSPPDRAIQKIYAVPQSVRVLIPRRLAQERIQIRTAPIDLMAIRATTTMAAKLVLPPQVQLEGGQPSSVQVVIKVRKKTP